MNYQLYSMLCGLLLFASSLSAQASKTIHQTFTVDGAEQVNINVVGSKVEIKETKGSRILVETTVLLSVSNARLLDFVANSGRYDLEKTADPATNELTISSKKGLSKKSTAQFLCKIKFCVIDPLL
jgi:membrane protease subunit (stomatin/prohibitin family)